MKGRERKEEREKEREKGIVRRREKQYIYKYIQTGSNKQQRNEL